MAQQLLKKYKVLYILDLSDGKKLKIVIRNIHNALEVPRLKEKLKVELIACIWCRNI